MANIDTTRTTASTNTWTKTFTKQVILKWLHLIYTSAAAAGNRQIRMQLKDSSGNLVWDSHAGAVQAASNAYHYNFLPGIYRETSFVDSEIQCPLAEGLVIQGGMSLTLVDNAGISASDSMVIAYQTEDAG